MSAGYIGYLLGSFLIPFLIGGLMIRGGKGPTMWWGGVVAAVLISSVTGFPDGGLVAIAVCILWAALKQARRIA